jgi:hypothetical protein
VDIANFYYPGAKTKLVVSTFCFFQNVTRWAAKVAKTFRIAAPPKLLASFATTANDRTMLSKPVQDCGTNHSFNLRLMDGSNIKVGFNIRLQPPNLVNRPFGH